MSERYDVIAKAAGNPPRDQIVLMLRTLLAERFKLAVHYETPLCASLGLFPIAFQARPSSAGWMNWSEPCAPSILTRIGYKSSRRLVCHAAVRHATTFWPM
jgi:hypothetical protein